MLWLPMTGVFAKSHSIQPLELRPYLQDRFENNCAIRQLYDFHDENTDLIQPLSNYVGAPKYIENNALNSTKYSLKNVTYAGIPVTKIEFSYGRLAQQYNQFLTFDLKRAKHREKFKTLKFKQQHEGADVSIEYKDRVATVQCYWLRE